MHPLTRFRAGSYSGEAASSCSPCVRGKFTEGEGEDSCSFCDDVLFDSFTASEGSSSANMCICTAGFYAPAAEEEDAKCTICPAGSDCAEPGATVATLQLEPGHWRSSNESTEILKCDNEEACAPACDDKTEQIKEQTGGVVEDCSYYEEYCADDSALVNSATQPYPEGWLATHCAKTCGLCGQLTCAEGHAGPLCELCEEGWAMSQGSCVSCDSSGSKAAGAFAVVGVIVVIIGVMLFGVYSYNEDRIKELKDGSFQTAKDQLGVPIKLVIQYVQIVSMMEASLDINFPKTMKSTATSFSAANVEFMSLAPVGCVGMGMDHDSKLLLYTGVLMGIGVVVALRRSLMKG